MRLVFFSTLTNLFNKMSSHNINANFWIYTYQHICFLHDVMINKCPFMKIRFTRSNPVIIITSLFRVFFAMFLHTFYLVQKCFFFHSLKSNKVIFIYKVNLKESGLSVCFASYKGRKTITILPINLASFDQKLVFFLKIKFGF